MRLYIPLSFAPPLAPRFALRVAPCPAKAPPRAPCAPRAPCGAFRVCVQEPRPSEAEAVSVRGIASPSHVTPGVAQLVANASFARKNGRGSAARAPRPAEPWPDSPRPDPSASGTGGARGHSSSGGKHCWDAACASGPAGSDAAEGAGPCAQKEAGAAPQPLAGGAGARGHAYACPGARKGKERAPADAKVSQWRSKLQDLSTKGGRYNPFVNELLERYETGVYETPIDGRGAQAVDAAEPPAPGPDAPCDEPRPGPCEAPPRRRPPCVQLSFVPLRNRPAPDGGPPAEGGPATDGQPTTPGGSGGGGPRPGFASLGDLMDTVAPNSPDATKETTGAPKETMGASPSRKRLRFQGDDDDEALQEFLTTEGLQLHGSRTPSPQWSTASSPTLTASSARSTNSTSNTVSSASTASSGRLTVSSLSTASSGRLTVSSLSTASSARLIGGVRLRLRLRVRVRVCVRACARARVCVPRRAIQSWATCEFNTLRCRKPATGRRESDRGLRVELQFEPTADVAAAPAAAPAPRGRQARRGACRAV